MTDMQITIWLRRETGTYGVVNPLCQVLVDLHLDKIL